MCYFPHPIIFDYPQNIWQKLWQWVTRCYNYTWLLEFVLDSSGHIFPTTQVTVNITQVSVKNLCIHKVANKIFRVNIIKFVISEAKLTLEKLPSKKLPKLGEKWWLKSPASTRRQNSTVPGEIHTLSGNLLTRSLRGKVSSEIAFTHRV